MTALSLAIQGAVHTGSCLAVPRALAEAALRLGDVFRSARGAKEYCLHDREGRPLGVIRRAAGRPAVGRFAPTVYLSRN